MNTILRLWGYITKWQQHTEWQYIGPHKKEFCELTHGSWHGLKLLIIQNKNQTIIYLSADNKVEHFLWHFHYAWQTTCSSLHLLYPSFFKDFWSTNNVFSVSKMVVAWLGICSLCNQLFIAFLAYCRCFSSPPRTIFYKETVPLN